MLCPYFFEDPSTCKNQSCTVFATGQSVRPEPGRGRTTVCRPVRSFSQVARQVKIKDEDGRHSVVPSGLFWNLPHSSERRTVPHRPPPSPAVPRRLPLFSVVFRCFPPSPAVPCRPPPPPAVPYRPLPEYVSDRGACRPS